MPKHIILPAVLIFAIAVLLLSPNSIQRGGAGGSICIMPDRYRFDSKNYKSDYSKQLKYREGACEPSAYNVYDRVGRDGLELVGI
jgi:hypothetical protein